MKNIYITCMLACSSLFLFGGAHAAISSTACGNLNENTIGCDACFFETEKVYGCNQYQASCVKQGLSDLSDLYTNSGTTRLVQWIDGIGPGVQEEYELQSAADWQISANPIYQVPSSFGPIFSANNGDRYTVYEPGDTKKWTEMISGKFYRFHEAKPGIQYDKAVFRVDFVPKSQSVTSQNPTVLADPEDHRQCVFYYAAACGDGVVQPEFNEQCDDGNMTSGDGCSNSCQNENVSNPICNSLTISPTVVQGTTTVFYTCNAANASSYTIQLFNPNNTVIKTLTNASGTFTVPATPDGVYRAKCSINGNISSSACEKTIQNNPETVATCNSLTATPTTISGQTSVNFTCDADNATSYYIEVRSPSNSIVDTLYSASGSITIPGTPDGMYTARCTVNSTITNNNCTAVITNNPQVQPEILVIKDDQDTPHNDYQLVNVGDDAKFTITVRNIGQESLNSISLSDALAPECNRSATQVQAIMSAAGLGNTLDPGEEFEYLCQKNSITTSTFPANTNTICVVGTGVTSGLQDNHCDDTYITPSQTEPAIQIIKDDSDNHDDRQYISVGETATFDITVYNIGNETLRNVVIADQYAANCVRSDGATQALIDNVGNGNIQLDPGESFTYTCSRSGVTTTTFPNNQNTACVTARGVQSNKSIDDCDPTFVFTSDPQPNINIIKDDADNYDDTQTLEVGGRARFTIIVENTGDEILENVVIDDPRAPDCDRSSSQTRALYAGSTFDPGEKFTYQCDRSNVSGSTFPNGENVACVQARWEVSNEQVDDCDPTRVRFESENKNPRIKIIKDDSDNHDDMQYIISGEVRFDITIENTGDAPLENILITDEFASECNRAPNQTQWMYPGSVFDEDETIRYTCRVFDAKMSDFPNGINRICVRGTQVGTSNVVTDCDDTRIRPEQDLNGFCQELKVNRNTGTQELRAEFICLGNAQKEYYLDILTPDGRLLKTIQDEDGKITHTFGLGSYKTRCRIDNQTSVTPACEQNISVTDSNMCQHVRSDRGNVGPTGFQTTISCDARPGDACEIQVKDARTGQVKTSYNVCSRTLKFSREGEYDIQCIVNGQGGQQCSTDITIKNPTVPKTGSIGMILLSIVSILTIAGIYLIRKNILFR